MCVWVEDADKLKIDSKELNIVYFNRRVQTFINGSDCLGIAGIKGQGKTFLIKVKRKRINGTTTVCLPKNIAVDTIDSNLHIHESLMKYLSDYNSWVGIWKTAICVTIIRYIKQFYPDESIHYSVSKFTDEFIQSTSDRRYRPSTVIHSLLKKDIRELRVILADTSALMMVVSNINKSIAIFLDKIDQGFSRYAKNFNVDSVMPQRSRNASIWQYAQFGLAEAAYDIFNLGTHHVKVYFTIRQEALIDNEKLNKDKARNILSYISEIRYSKLDLEEMYALYIANEDGRNLLKKEYKKINPSYAFLGIDQIQHGYVKGKNEKVFDYIYRHTMQRPYDIMKICRALFMVGKEIDTQNTRHTINHEGNELLKRYLHELSNFVPIDIDKILSMSTMLNGNIISIEYMKEVCALLNKEVDMKWTCNTLCSQCLNIQPFSILYNLGLIGTIKKSPADAIATQSFKNVGSSIIGLNEHHIPSSRYYFIHPSLANYARDERYKMGLAFWSNSEFIVGDGCECVDNDYIKRKMKRYFKRSIDQLKKEKVFVSSTINDLDKTRAEVESTLKSRGLHPILSERPIFDITQAQDNHSHDHCIDEMLKCKSVVFLIGEEYGGIYKGNQHKSERNEIIEEASREHVDIRPSISLMEYYVARKNNGVSQEIG